MSKGPTVTAGRNPNWFWLCKGRLSSKLKITGPALLFPVAMQLLAADKIHRKKTSNVLQLQMRDGCTKVTPLTPTHHFTLLFSGAHMKIVCISALSTVKKKEHRTRPVSIGALACHAPAVASKTTLLRKITFISIRLNFIYT